MKETLDFLHRENESEAAKTVLDYADRMEQSFGWQGFSDSLQKYEDSFHKVNIRISSEEDRNPFISVIRNGDRVASFTEEKKLDLPEAEYSIFGSAGSVKDQVEIELQGDLSVFLDLTREEVVDSSGQQREVSLKSTLLSPLNLVKRLSRRFFDVFAGIMKQIWVISHQTATLVIWFLILLAVFYVVYMAASTFITG